MYDKNDKESATRYAQSQLKDLGFYKHTINGTLDASTKDAIKRFQSEAGLTVTGNIDRETTEEMYRRYARKKSGTYNASTIKEGDNSLEIRAIKQMMRKVLEYYYGAYDLDLSTYYSPETEEAKNELEKIFGIKSEIGISPEFYKRLTEEERSIDKILNEI